MTTRSYGSQDEELEVLHTNENWGRANEEEYSFEGSTN